jgi:hypothetical protein
MTTLLCWLSVTASPLNNRKASVVLAVHEAVEEVVDVLRGHTLHVRMQTTIRLPDSVEEAVAGSVDRLTVPSFPTVIREVKF